MAFVCSLCPRRCYATRDDDGGNGVCGMPALPRLARAALHFGEEPCISGTRGSGTVFFSGCSLRCRFCQNHSISEGGYGKTVSVARLSDIFRALEAQGAHNINLVNPTHYAHAIRQALDLYRPSIPIVYNTGGYERVETLRALEGYVDIYLPDLKYLNGTIAASLSGAEDYPNRATAAIREMVRQTGHLQLDADGIAVRGTLVRHLVLPGHTRESIAVLSWLYEQYAADVSVSVLLQYTPIGALSAPLNRPLTARECRKIRDFVEELGVSGYIQRQGSNGTEYIPAFDLTGV